VLGFVEKLARLLKKKEILRDKEGVFSDESKKELQRIRRCFVYIAERD
jgi:hypothetical protein